MQIHDDEKPAGEAAAVTTEPAGTPAGHSAKAGEQLHKAPVLWFLLPLLLLVLYGILTR